jgi:hypothetical protein
MPKIGDDLEQFNIAGSRYGFSGTRVADLEATEYTLVTIVFDESGSTDSFAREMEKATQEIVKSCQSSPRADNLLLRLLNFGTGLREVHGYRPLSACNLADYDGFYQNGGITSLFDSAHNAIAAANAYAKTLSDADYLCNSIIFVLTDGADNNSKFTAKHVGDELRKSVASEAVESQVAALIGVNVADANLDRLLTDFANTAGFAPIETKDANGNKVTKPYLALGNADAKTLARVAQFVSRSISSQSQALGSGGASAPLTF